jgi:hypothetical protein
MCPPHDDHAGTARHSVWLEGDSLFITKTRGECGDDQTLSGHYFREARFLRTLRLEIDGGRAWLCEAATIEPHMLSFSYVYPEVAEYGSNNPRLRSDCGASASMRAPASSRPRSSISRNSTRSIGFRNVGGDARDDRPTPGAYPHANTPQLWNATAFPLLVHTMLGLQPLAPLETLVVAPDLPTWLPEIVLSNLRIGAATATIRFWRGQNGHSHAEIAEKKGTIRLIHQLRQNRFLRGRGIGSVHYLTPSFVENP